MYAQMFACVWGIHECVLRLMSGVVFCLSLPMYGGMVEPPSEESSPVLPR